MVATFSRTCQIYERCQICKICHVQTFRNKMIARLNDDETKMYLLLMYFLKGGALLYLKTLFI